MMVMEEDSTAETTMDETDDSAENTRQCICSALQGTGDLSFITATALRRPTFALLQKVTCFCQDLHFAEGLYNDTDADVAPTTRKDKISFLVKVLAVVSILTGERHDVYVSPAKILCGQDVVATHGFLLALAGRACKVPPEQSKEAAAQVLVIGETTLYKRAVRTRNTMIKFQAICRGRLVRQRRSGGDKEVGGEIRKVDNEPTTDTSTPDSATPTAEVPLDISDDELSLTEEERLDDGDGEQRAIDSLDVRGLIEEKVQTIEIESESSETSTPSLPPELSIPNPTEVYVGLDGKIKVAANEETDELKTATATSTLSPSSSADTDETLRAPLHDQNREEKNSKEKPTMAPKQKKSSLPKRPIPTSIRSNRSRQKVDAYTSCELDNVEMMKDMSELHVKQLQHRESVEVFRKAEVNLKVRVQRTTEKELELKRKEAELKDREDRVTRVAENLRKQQHILRQREDALNTHQANGRNLGSASGASTGKIKNESKPTMDPNIAAEIKGLKRKLFRSERRVQRREDQIRAMFKRLSRLSKAHQRLTEEAKTNASEEEAERSSWLIERSTNNISAGGKRMKKRQDLPTDPSIQKDAESECTDGSIETTRQQQPAEKDGACTCTSTGGKSKRQSNPSELPKRTGKPSVSFSPNVEVTRIPPPPPHAASRG